MIKSLVQYSTCCFVLNHTHTIVDLTYGPIVGYEHYGFQIVI
jgi:hypothetical protein